MDTMVISTTSSDFNRQVSTLWWMFDIGKYSNTNSPAKHLQVAVSHFAKYV